MHIDQKFNFFYPQGSSDPVMQASSTDGIPSASAAEELKTTAAHVGVATNIAIPTQSKPGLPSTLSLQELFSPTSIPIFPHLAQHIAGPSSATPWGLVSTPASHSQAFSLFSNNSFDRTLESPLGLASYTSPSLIGDEEVPALDYDQDFEGALFPAIVTVSESFPPSTFSPMAANATLPPMQPDDNTCISDPLTALTTAAQSLENDQAESAMDATDTSSDYSSSANAAMSDSTETTMSTHSNPVERSASSSTVKAKRSSRPPPTGFRGTRTPLLGLDAPVQPRRYSTSSATSRRDRSIADLERKRLQNTISARKSRARKQERLDQLEEENEYLKAECERLRDAVRQLGGQP